MMVLILSLIIITFLLIVIWTVVNGISPMPTSSKVKKKLFEALPDSVDGTILELGSGWATLATPLAKRYPTQKVIGYETSPIPYFYSWLLSRIKKLPNLHFERTDFFQVPLDDAKLIVCYLYPKAMERLRKKFEEELSEETFIVSHTFAIPGWTAKKVVEVDDLYKTKIYFYKMPPLR